jgi:hypothetical protein
MRKNRQNSLTKFFKVVRERPISSQLDKRRVHGKSGGLQSSASSDGTSPDLRDFRHVHPVRTILPRLKSVCLGSMSSPRFSLHQQGRLRSFSLLNVVCDVVDRTQDPRKIALEIEADLPALSIPFSENLLAHIQIFIEDDLSSGTGGISFRTSLGKIRFKNNWRLIDFIDGGRGKFDYSKEPRAAHFEARCSVDVIENFMAASWGELLENLGYRRLHAAAFLKKNGMAEVIVAPSGAGKSTLVAQLISRGEKVFSDEIVLIKGDTVFAFPLPVASESIQTVSTRSRKFLGSSKPLLPIALKSVAAPSKVECIFFVTNSPRLVRPFEWVLVVTLGLGLPQMKEYLVRSDSFFALPRVAVRRIAFALGNLISRRVAFQSEREFRSRP